MFSAFFFGNDMIKNVMENNIKKETFEKEIAMCRELSKRTAANALGANAKNAALFLYCIN